MSEAWVFGMNSAPVCLCGYRKKIFSIIRVQNLIQYHKFKCHLLDWIIQDTEETIVILK